MFSWTDLCLKLQKSHSNSDRLWPVLRLLLGLCLSLVKVPDGCQQLSLITYKIFREKSEKSRQLKTNNNRKKKLEKEGIYCTWLLTDSRTTYHQYHWGAFAWLRGGSAAIFSSSPDNVRPTGPAATSALKLLNHTGTSRTKTATRDHAQMDTPHLDRECRPFNHCQWTIVLEDKTLRDLLTFS